ncbi:MAG: H/ACA ribonucleoprotein complex subunit GAR1 [Nitrososphaeraceae archaeon]
MKTSTTNNLSLTVVGKILHKAKSGRLIIKLDENVDVNNNSILFNSIGKKIGIVNELIGPINSPYASIILIDDKFRIMQGDKIYKSNSKTLNLYDSKKNKKRKIRDKL